MKSEKQVRDKINRLISGYFGGKIKPADKPRIEHQIRGLLWVIDEKFFDNKRD